MLIYKTVLKRVVFVVSLFSALMLVSCSDSPEGKAGKNLRQTVDAALEIVNSTGDYEKAYDLLASAIAKAPRGSVGLDAAHLASGNISYGQGQDLQIGLIDAARPVRTTVGRISTISINMYDLQRQKELLGDPDYGLLASEQVKLAQIQKWIDEGDDDTPALVDELKETQAELDELTAKKDEYEAKARTAMEKGDAVQEEANINLRKAEMLKGDEKLDLQLKGYTLLLSKKEFDKQMQDAMDMSDLVSGQIAIVSPLLDKIKKNLEEAKGEIAEIRGSGRQDAVKEQLALVLKQMNAEKKVFAGLVSSLKQGSVEYRAQVEQVVGLYERAVTSYGKVRSRTGSDLTSARAASSHFAIATAYAANVKFHMYVKGRLEAVISTMEFSGVDVLKNFVGAIDDLVASGSKLAMASFDKSIDGYGNTQSSDKNFASSVTKSHLLAVYGKIELAEQIGMEDGIDGLYGIAEELVGKAQEQDPLFAKSAIARIVSRDENYIPRMTVDEAEYWEGVKQEFSSWKKLRGEDKEAEVNRLLQVASEFEAPDDLGAFNRIMVPEIKLLRQALKKGFDDDGEDDEFGDDEDWGDSSDDPNS